MNRRTFLTQGSSALAGLAAVGAPYPAEDIALPSRPGVPLALEPLPFDIDALEPHLDARTLKLHREAHHSEILENLRQVLKEMRMPDANVLSLLPNLRYLILPPDPRQRLVRMGGPPERATPEMQTALRRYGGAHVNHTAFWRFLAPPGSCPAGPQGRLARALVDEFGTIAGFKEAYTEAAVRHEGSGWAFLVYRKDRRLAICTMKNEDNPLMSGVVRRWHEGRFILCLDLWEHAYYLKYRDDRRKYVNAWWNVVNWDFVARAYDIVTTYF